MRTQTSLLALGLIAVAAASYLVGHSRPRRAPVTPEETTAASTGGPKENAGRTAPQPRTPEPRPAKPHTSAPSTEDDAPPPIPGIARTERPSKPDAPPAETYTNRTLGLTIARPAGPAWAMTSERASFRDPIRHPSKLVEIRRDPRDGSSQYAVIELFAIDIPPDSTAEAERGRFERLGRRGEKADSSLVGERSVTVGAHTFTRRICAFKWKDANRETRLLSLSTVLGERLVLLLAFTDARYFDEVLSEFDQAIDSLKID